MDRAANCRFPEGVSCLKCAEDAHPEQLRGSDPDHRSDIYSFGVVLYEMATGQRPFQERLATALANDIITKPPPPPGRLKPDLSSRLEETILKALEKEPENRDRKSVV